MLSIIRFFTLGLLITLPQLAQAYPIAYLEDLNQQKITAAQLQGKWLIVNFWASWCSPCVAEIVELNKLQQNARQRIQVFAVNYDALTLEEQRATAKQYQIQYTNLSLSSIQKLGLKDIDVVPTTFIFNPEGKLVNTLYGGQTTASIEQAINAQAQLLR